MRKMYFFGCSYTYGHGLEDCIEVPSMMAGQNPSKLNWAQMLGDDLGFEVVNFAFPGASNKHIMHVINCEQHDLEPGAPVVIHWSHFERTMRFNAELERPWLPYNTNGRPSWESCVEKIGPWLENDLGNSYYAYIQSDLNDAYELAWFIDYATLKLANRGAGPVLHLGPALWKPDQAEVISKFLGNDVHWPAMSIVEKDIPHGYDKAHDKKHPGPRAHRSFADDVIARYSNFLKS
jgi:hypothetical protein